MKRGTVREDGMVYLRKVRGKEVWGTAEQFANLEKWRKNYMEKRRNDFRLLPIEKRFKIGDYNPENGKYFIRLSGNLTPMWGTPEDVIKFRNQRREIKEKYVARKKEERLNQNKPEHRWKRGDIDPILNLVFFKYNYLTGAEFWYTREKFDHMLKKDKECRKRNAVQKQKL